MKHPIQYIKDGRFIENKIVRYLLDAGPFDMNKLAVMNFDQGDSEQFAQLIGYSLSGFSSLSYVSDETYGAASAMSEGENNELLARISDLESTLEELRSHLRPAACAVFRIHPDDLK